MKKGITFKGNYVRPYQLGDKLCHKKSGTIAFHCISLHFDLPISFRIVKILNSINSQIE